MKGKVSQSQAILSKKSPSNVSSSSTVKRVQFPLGVNNGISICGLLSILDILFIFHDSRNNRYK